jgi:hypothetical protein
MPQPHVPVPHVVRWRVVPVVEPRHQAAAAAPTRTLTLLPSGRLYTQRDAAALAALAPLPTPSAQEDPALAAARALVELYAGN